jgi:uncharacterized tellurite resistance protein B-like protein
MIDWFRTMRTAAATDKGGDTDTVRRIVSELDKLDPARARFLAAFAYVLSRVAGADQHVSDVETAKMIELVQRFGHLTEPQAVLVVEIAKSQNRLFGGTENFLVTREFRTIASDDERRDALECVFAVSVADETMTPEEEAQIRQIASELGFSHEEYVRARLAYTDKRTVFRKRGPA